LVSGRSAKVSVQANRLDERMVHEVEDLPAGGADRQGTGGFENHRRCFEESLEKASKLAQSFLAPVGRRGLLELRGAESASPFLETHRSAGQDGIH